MEDGTCNSSVYYLMTFDNATHLNHEMDPHIVLFYACIINNLMHRTVNLICVYVYPDLYTSKSYSFSNCLFYYFDI